jgi:hypothetical protein
LIPLLPKSERGGTVALIVGAGAVANSWAPVIRAIESEYDFSLTADGATSAMARWVYLMRWYALSPNADAKKHLASAKGIVGRVAERIKAELLAAQRAGELSTRPEFPDITDRLVRHRGDRFFVLSTNWDTVVEDSLSARLSTPVRRVSIEALHVHGSARAGEPLYLPTEVTKEPYRSRAEENTIGGLHGSMMTALEGARWVVVYGLSLSPLDAELCQALAAGWSNPIIEGIDVVVPAHDLAVVAHRVNLLLDPRRRVRVTGFDPTRLDQPVDYTVQR